jgi:hypothetical protein
LEVLLDVLDWQTAFFCLSTTAAAAALNNCGIVTPSGDGKWHAMQVHRVRQRLT